MEAEPEQSAEEIKANGGKLKARMRQALKRSGPKAARLTAPARKVLTLAQSEARRLNHDYIGAEHLLLAMMSEGEGIAARALNNLGVDLDQARETVLRFAGRGNSTDAGEKSLTASSKKAIELAVDEAKRLKHDYIGTEHLLLGLIREGEGVATGVLASFGVSPEQIRAQVMELIASIGQAVKPAEKATKNNVVMCRLDDRDLDAIDTLIEAGICTTRSDAAAWLIHAGIEANTTLLTSVRDTVAEIRRLREVAQAMAQRTLIRDAEPVTPSSGERGKQTPEESPA
jgi:ATP-dependent Clp protease ATP-binding subunit ClpA